MTDTNYQEKARAVKSAISNLGGEYVVNAITAALNEVAEEALAKHATKIEERVSFLERDMDPLYVKVAQLTDALDRADRAEAALAASKNGFAALLAQHKNLMAKLYAFESATPESPEVKEALASIEGVWEKHASGPTCGVVRHDSEVLARAYRSALVRIKELETCDGCGSGMQNEAYCRTCYTTEHPI